MHPADHALRLMALTHPAIRAAFIAPEATADIYPTDPIVMRHNTQTPLRLAAYHALAITSLTFEQCLDVPAWVRVIDAAADKLAKGQPVQPLQPTHQPEAPTA